MAQDTAPALQNQVIYSVFIRNHTEEGTFRALIPDLDRIRALGVDILWLMPIHPIGELCRKGSLGSPYANRDYRALNPEYGDMEDFRELVDAIHARGMKCMIDVVYNHTSPDSMWNYQVESLKHWAELVDGFRCDVASFVPVEFWLRARREIVAIKPGFLWLAESVHRTFSVMCRRRGMYVARDVEAFEAFDMEYEYDVRDAFDDYLDGKGSLTHWTDLLNFQEFSYPANYNKLRFLENHDTARIAPRVRDARSLRNFTAMLYFLKGTTLLYAGQEVAAVHTPSLFDADKIQWETGSDLAPLMRTLYRLKRETLSANDLFDALADASGHIAVMTRDDGKQQKVGVFSLRGEAGTVSVNLPDGRYPNLLGEDQVEVLAGLLRCDGEPVWICAAKNMEVLP